MKTLIRAIALSAAPLFTVPLFAQEYRILVAPPALQTEVIPDQPFANAVWQPGYFTYDPTLMNYTFVSGQWVTPPFTGATWISPSYQFSNGEYLFVPGRWMGTNGEIITTTVPRTDDIERDRNDREQRRLKKLNKIKVKEHDED